ncbi:MAG: hypothetical protein PHI52_05695, partial [Bacteroidales bacterium]|nr:hypothetical protein [Bacteroidales bacterium]
PTDKEFAYTPFNMSEVTYIFKAYDGLSYSNAISNAYYFYITIITCKYNNIVKLLFNATTK